MILKDIKFTGSEVKQQNREMFHRIWKIFSSYIYNSPSTDHGHSKRVEPERTKVVSVYAGRGQTVNITNRPSSDITSMLTWLPGTSYEEPGLEYENARKRVKDPAFTKLNSKKRKCANDSGKAHITSVGPQHQLASHTESKNNSDSCTRSDFQSLNVSSKFGKPIQAKFSAKCNIQYLLTYKYITRYIFRQKNTATRESGTKYHEDTKPHCQHGTPPKNKSFKSINNVCHYKLPECSYQILDESNKILRSQKTAEVSSPNPSNEVRKPLQAKLSAKYTDEQTTEVSGARDKPQHSVRNFSCHPETPSKDNNFKPVNDVVHHNQRHRNEYNNPFPSQKTTDICSDNLSNETRNPLQSRIPPKYMHEQSFTNVSDAKNHKDRKHNKQQFSLRNFTCKLETTPKDKSFKPVNDVVYHNQWTECSYQIFDEFNNPLCLKKTSLADVSSSSRYVEFRDIKIKKDHLHFKMKSIQTGNISILIKIDNYALTKDFCVTFNPCSSSLSDMTIEKINPVEEEFVYRLFLFDVFGEPVPLNSTATLELDASFPSDENKVVSKVKHIEQEQVCYDITVRGNRPWSRDLIVLLNGKQVNHAREFEFTNEECNAINNLDDDDYEWIQKVFPESDCGIFIPLTTGHDDGMFVAYNEDDCELQSQNAKDHQLICKNVRKHDILGVDFAHIDNMRRVLEIKDRVEIERIDSHAIIHLRNIRSHLRPICKQVVQHLLRGLYYRRKASEAARIRMEWKNRLISIDEILLSSKKEASFVFCKYFKDFFDDLLNQYNRKACDELFKFFNFHRDESEVDLHGLLVADEKKLESLRLNLLIGSLRQDQIKKLLEICEIESKQGRERQTFRKKFRQGKVPEDLVRKFLRDDRIINEDSSDKSEHECSHEDCNLGFEDDDHDFSDDTDEKDNKYYDSDLEPLRSYDCKDNVDAIIRRCRKERDEAIRKLKETMEKFNEEAIFNETSKPSWLEIIVGAGQHSKNNEQKIRPKVEKFLKERNLKFVPANKGSLVVTFKPYDGPEPCFGEYYCKKCDRCWKSSKSYIEKYQKCSACTSICRPFKQREKEKVANYCRSGARSMKRKPKPHQSSLCQKCHELRRPCNDVYHTRK